MNPHHKATFCTELEKVSTESPNTRNDLEQRDENQNKMALAENQTRQPMARMVNPERVSIICILPIIYKGSEHPYWRKDNVYNKQFWENWITVCIKL